MSWQLGVAPRRIREDDIEQERTEINEYEKFLRRVETAGMKIEKLLQGSKTISTAPHNKESRLLQFKKKSGLSLRTCWMHFTIQTVRSGTLLVLLRKLLWVMMYSSPWGFHHLHTEKFRSNARKIRKFMLKEFKLVYIRVFWDRKSQSKTVRNIQVV